MLEQMPTGKMASRKCSTMALLYTRYESCSKGLEEMNILNLQFKIAAVIQRHVPEVHLSSKF